MILPSGSLRQHPLYRRLLIFGQRRHVAERRDRFILEIPAGHLPERQPPGKFIRGDFLLPLAYVVGDVESLADREFAVMEDGAGGGRFFGFAFGAPAGVRGFSRTGIGIPAFPAGKTLRPFQFGQEFQAGLVAGKQLVKFLVSQAFLENFAHNQIGALRVMI